MIVFFVAASSGTRSPFGFRCAARRGLFTRALSFRGRQTASFRVAAGACDLEIAAAGSPRRAFGAGRPRRTNGAGALAAAGDRSGTPLPVVCDEPEIDALNPHRG